MKKHKLLCILCALLLAGCGAVDDSTETKKPSKNSVSESSSHESVAETSSEESSEIPDSESTSESEPDDSKAENTEPDLPDTITPIPGGEDTVLYIFSTADPNTSPSTTLRTELDLFAQYGGTVKLSRYPNSNDRFDELAARLLSGTDIPDMMWLNNFSFPSYAVKELFQPIDGIVDFDSSLWAETKQAADLYSISGRHYAAPISITPASLMLYRKDIIESNGLDDPYELYMNGKWNRETLFGLMDTFCEQEGHYGINGYFTDALFRAEGLPIVGFDGKEFVNNMDNEKLLPIVDYLYDIRDRGFIASGWWDKGEDALKDGNILFYSMGPWAMTGTRALTEQKYGLVPMPSEDNAYNVGDAHSMLWVAGSEKSGAMKTWLECMRYCETDKDTQNYLRDKFFSDNPGWTDEMYEVYKSQTGFDKPLVSEYAYGLSPELTTIDQELGYAPADLVTDPITSMYLDKKYDWEQLKGMYLGLIDDHVKEYNQKL
ncbi:MAG: extracellular solute-binding protein [Ruminococcus sp.]|nr:extracellular solute-binding protein [Ruminococcus sp.]